MITRLPALELADRAAAAAGRGVRVIPMNGVPAVTMPSHVQDAACAAAARVFDRQSRGHADLRAAIAAELATSQGLAVEPDTELLISHGAQHGMSVVLRALLSPGDEAVIPAPTYLYDGTVRMAGVRPVYVPTRASAGWQLDVDAIADAITPRTRAVLLCNPNNPTGNLPRPSQLEAIAALAERHGLYLLSDESYSRYVYIDDGYTPIAALRHLHRNMVTVTSLSKNYAFTNWRIGYVHASSELIDRVLAAFEWDAINVGDVPQAAATAVISGSQEWIVSILRQYRAKRDLMVKLVQDAGLEAVTPEAGVFISVDFNPWECRGRELEQTLLALGITALSLDAFQGPGDHARLLFGAAERDLRAVGAALRQRGRPVPAG